MKVFPVVENLLSGIEVLKSEKVHFKMTSLVYEPNTLPAANIVEGFFQKIPIDKTRNRFRFENILPTTALQSNSKSSKGGAISFKISAKDVPYSYDLSKIYIDVKFKILRTQTLTLPDAGKKISGINNMLSSLFQYCSVFINGTPITDTPGTIFTKLFKSNLIKKITCTFISL